MRLFEEEVDQREAHQGQSRPEDVRQQVRVPGRFGRRRKQRNGRINNTSYSPAASLGRAGHECTLMLGNTSKVVSESTGAFHEDGMFTSFCLVLERGGSLSRLADFRQRKSVQS